MPFYATEKYESFSGGSSNSSERFFNNEIMSRLIVLTGIKLNYVVDNTFDINLSFQQNVNSALFRSPDRFGDSPTSKTNMTMMTFGLGYRF